MAQHAYRLAGAGTYIFLRLHVFFTLIALTFGLYTNAQTTSGCEAGTCVFAGPRLASIDTARGALSDALFSALLGSNVSVDALDWNALASGEVGLASTLEALRLELNASNTEQVLGTDLSLFGFVDVLADVAQADGDLAAANALRTLGTSFPGLTGTFQLGELLQLDFPEGALGDVQLNVLSLLTGAVQLYNYRNVLTTPSPVTLSASALGLEGVLNGVELYAQVVEPPLYICGGSGTQFYSAAVRLKLNLDLVDTDLDTSNLETALETALGPNVTATAEARLSQLQLYVAVARAQGVIESVDAISRAVTLRATPGVADLYIGEIGDAAFFNRTQQIVPASDLSPGVLGTLDIKLEQTLPAGTLADTSTTILAKSDAQGEAPFADDLTFAPPFPQKRSASTSADFASVLLNDLVNNTELTLGGSLGAQLDPLVNTVILPTLRPLVTDALTSTLSPVLTELVDPLLETLGIRIGEVDVSVLGVGAACTVTGTIYNDLDQNGVQNANEGWLGGTLVFVNLVKEGVLIASAPVDPDTGHFNLFDIPEGDCTLLLAPSATSSSPEAPEGFGFLSPASGTLSLEVSPEGALNPTFSLRPLKASFLLISEEVRNVSAGEVDFTVANLGEPGDVLEYCVRYVNPGTESVRDVLLQTTAPSYTVVEPSVADYGGSAIKLLRADGITDFLSGLLGDDDGEFIERLVRVRLTEVRAQESGRMCYRVRIQ